MMLESRNMTSGNPKSRVRFGPYEADLDTQELWKSGVRLKLGGQPFGLLTMLLKRPGELVTRDELHATLWSSDTFVDFNHGLNAAMNKLRDCLNDSADDPKYIETLPRRGYRFIAQVQRNGDKPEAKVAAPPAPPRPVGEPLEKVSWLESAPVDSVPIPYRWLVVFTLLLIVGVAGALFHFYSGARRSGAELAGILPGAPRPSVAPVFSPDGQKIAFRLEDDSELGKGSGHPTGIYVSDLGSGALTSLTQERESGNPTWSPDGESLAFVRTKQDDRAIYKVSAKGGEVSRMAKLNSHSSQTDLDWSPDGKYIVFTGVSPNGSAPLFAFSIATNDVLPLTDPVGKDQDWGPAYSPDGKRIAFVRRRSADLAENIFVASLQGAAAQQLTFGGGAIESPPTWTSDGNWVVYTTSQSGEARLWRVPSTGGPAETLPGIGAPSLHPSIPREAGTLLAYQSILGDSSIWRLNVSQVPASDAGLVVISAAGSNEGPRLSPNGRKLAFMSNRGGSMEIWISDPDGSYPLKLTNLDGCGSPQWSPDSRSIAFDSVHGGRPGVYVVNLDGGEPRVLADGSSQNLVPSWSHDGRWIYFASDRAGQDNIWKVRSTGGDAVRVTQHEGFAPIESPDGKTLYFATSRFPNPEIAQMPVEGGKEAVVSPLLRPAFWAGWTVTEAGFYFLASQSEGRTALELFDPKTDATRMVTSLSGNAFWLSSSNDGQTLWFNQKQEGQNVILVKRDFH
jgi:Tol biopolymer transport system component/DNA-binding winged helix-turn-helix (wHTH) protein